MKLVSSLIKQLIMSPNNSNNLNPNFNTTFSWGDNKCSWEDNPTIKNTDFHGETIQPYRLCYTPTLRGKSFWKKLFKVNVRKKQRYAPNITQIAQTLIPG